MSSDFTISSTPWRPDKPRPFYDEWVAAHGKPEPIQLKPLQPYQLPVLSMASTMPKGTTLSTDLSAAPGWKFCARKGTKLTHRWTGKKWVKI